MTLEEAGNVPETLQLPAAMLGGLVGDDKLEELGEAETPGGPERCGMQGVTALWNE